MQSEMGQGSFKRGQVDANIHPLLAGESGNPRSFCDSWMK